MSSQDDRRIPPHSPEAEASLLSALLLDNESIHRIHLPPEAFHTTFYAQVYRAVQEMAAAGQPFDVVTVYERLRAKGQDQDGRALVHLNEIAQYMPSGSNIRRYAEIVNDHHRRRQLIATVDAIADESFDKAVPTAQVLDSAQMKLAKLATVRAKREPQHITQSVVDYLQHLDDLRQGKNPAIPTGIRGLDQLLNGGLRRGEMMVIGARPKHGKTALALALARAMAREYGVLFISQEMPVLQLMHRHTAAMGAIDLGRILRADPADVDLLTDVTEAADRLGRLHLVHDDQSAQSLMDVRRKAIKVKREHGLDVLFVDFLQLMQGAGGDDNRNRELDIIANGIKALAMDLDIAVVLLSQMSRKADEHYGRPTMTHLRDSGAIEAAADQVAVLFTDYAHPLSPKLHDFAGYSEIEIVAHRNGPQGLAPLQFRGQYQQISDWNGPTPKKSAPNAQKRGLHAGV
ncbi:replicative DNA helicase [Variovorax sp. PvP013]|uniref:replicative DNA helicase n=1 Tax=Variovorax sp. PvP013 TaxID=3156435 RepID=UPI003D1EE6B6